MKKTLPLVSACQLSSSAEKSLAVKLLVPSENLDM